MPEELPRRIGFWGGSAIMVGIIIGSGIFMTPTSIAKEMGSPAVILAFWVAGGLLSLFGALTFAELSAMFPRSGGLYVYLREGIGPRTAFTFGWTLMLLTKPFAAAALALTFASHFDALFGLSWNPYAVACAMLVVLTGLNTVTLRGSSAMAIVLTALKVLALAAIVVLGAVMMKGSAANFAPSSTGKPLWMAIAPVLFAVLWTYDGWADISAVAGEITDPGRLLPRILVAGTAATIGVYVAVNGVYFSLVPLAEMRGVETIAPLVLQRLLGPAASVAVTAMIVISTLGASHGSILVGARVTFAQAQDGLLFRFLGRVHPRYQTPAVSLWVQAALSCAAVLYLRRFKDLSEGYGFTMWIFYALGALSVLLLRSKRPEVPRPYHCWGYPVVPVLFLVVSLALPVLYVAHEWKSALPWLGVLLLGFPAYEVWTRMSKAAVASKDAAGKISGL